MASLAPASPLDEAVRAVEMVSTDPRRAFELAGRLLAGGDLDAESRAVAERAAALAELDLGRVQEARARFEGAKARALSSGARSGLPELRIGLAMALLQCEEPDAAMGELDAALAEAGDVATRGRAESQRATILMRLGRHLEGLEAAERAIATCRAAGLDASVARLLSNVGLVHAYLGDYAAAESALRLALETLRREGAVLGSANVVHNLGFVAGRRGDVPGALARFDEALEEYRRLDVPAHVAVADRCQVLLSVRLLPEARAAAVAAVAGLEAAGQAADLAEARLVLAEVALAQGDLATASAEARRAADSLRRQGRRNWATLADLVEARARWLSPPDPVQPERPQPGGADRPRHGGADRPQPDGADRPQPGGAGRIAEAAELARRLTAAGWRLQGLEAAAVGARAALAAGDPAGAVAVLSAVDTDGTDACSLSADERVRLRYGRALRYLAAGRRAECLETLSDGLRIAEEHRAAFGATELRARATVAASDLAELGLELALEEGSGPLVLDWSERWRARMLWPPAVLPPADGELADSLTQLRHTVAALEASVQLEEASPVASRRLARRRLEVETAIRQRSLATAGQRRASPPVPSVAEVGELLESMGWAAAIELVASGGELHAVVCTPTDCTVRRLGPLGELSRWRAAARFALSRLSAGTGSRASRMTAAVLLRRAVAATDRFLFRPLEPELNGAFALGRDELVIVPTGALHSLAWGLLPSLRWRPITLAPSLALVLDRHRQASAGTRRDGGVVLAAGPGVPSSGAEIAALARLYPAARVLTGREATAGHVACAINGAATAHLAAHGRFRADNALFSALEMADGPLTVYDLESVREPPELLVLSCCEAGQSDVQPGDELMGVAAAMLSLGSSAIVASVGPVPDAGAPTFMAEFHELLRSGSSPAAALSLVQARANAAALEPGDLADGSDDAAKALAAAGFVCLGVGLKGGGRRW